MQNLISFYKIHKSKIQSRLKYFKNLPEEQYLNELLFCILTPQSKARKCWEAIQQISKLKNPDQQNISEILKAKTRFHHTKTRRVIIACHNWRIIKPLLNHKNTVELRNFLAKNINGYGLKESSHFLRNIGKSNNKIAILDRHILRNLKELKIIKKEKISSQKQYLKTEKIFLNFSKEIQIPPDEIDLLFWSKENGEIFK